MGGRRLVDEFPYLEAEVKYAVKEYACTAVDVLARRTRLAFLHVHAADEAIPKIINIMANELGWSNPRMKVCNIDITSSSSVDALIMLARVMTCLVLS